MPVLSLVDPTPAPVNPGTDRTGESWDYADLVHTAFIAVWFAMTVLVFAVHP